MTVTERKERVEDIAQRYSNLDAEDKQYIAGYINGIQAERQKWEEKLALAGIPVLELLVKQKVPN